MAPKCYGRLHHESSFWTLYIQEKNTQSTWQNGYSTDTEIMSQMAADFSSETMEDKGDDLPFKH